MKTFTLGKFKIGFADRSNRDFLIVISIAGDFSLHVLRKPKVIAHDIVRKLAFWSLFLQVWPVYFVEWSRDCDNCEATYRHRFPTYWHAHKYMIDAYEHAEGMKSFDQITCAEYNDFKAEWLDRNLEAFENGNGTKVNI